MTRDEALQKMADVIPPAPPDYTAWWFGALAAVAIAAAATAALLWRRRRRERPVTLSPRIAAQRQLQQVYAAWKTHEIGDRDAAYRLAAILRLGLGLPQLWDAPPASAADDAALWRETLRQLHAQRYAAAGAPPLEAVLFDHARRWLASGAPH